MSKHAGRRAEVSRDRKSGSSGRATTKGQPPTKLERLFVAAMIAEREAVGARPGSLNALARVRQANHHLGELINAAYAGIFIKGEPFFADPAEFKKMTPDEKCELRRSAAYGVVAVVSSALLYICVEQALPAKAMQEIAQPLFSGLGFLIGVAGAAHMSRRISPTSRALDASFKRVREFCQPFERRQEQYAKEIACLKDIRRVGRGERESRAASQSCLYWKVPVAGGTVTRGCGARGSARSVPR